MERLPIGAPNDAKMPFIDSEYSPDAQALGCGHHRRVSKTQVKIVVSFQKRLASS